MVPISPHRTEPPIPKLRVLLVEDSADDAELLLDTLRGDGFDPESTRVETAGAFRAAITSESWDLVLCDHALPQFSEIPSRSN